MRGRADVGLAFGVGSVMDLESVRGPVEHDQTKGKHWGAGGPLCALPALSERPSVRVRTRLGCVTPLWRRTSHVAYSSSLKQTVS
jgi:hypothetical protein